VVRSDLSSNKTQGTTIGYMIDGYNIEFCDSQVLFKFPKSQRWKRGSLNNKRPSQPGNNIQEAADW
jgi:hypothetical protein